MTKLETIRNNHISLSCICGHSRLIAIKELLDTLPSDTTIHQVAGNARCSACGRKGDIDFRLHYVCQV